MTIKKLKPANAAPQTNAAAEGEVADMSADMAAPKTGATIADRFKLDMPDPAATRGALASKKATQMALTAGLAALAVVGVLTFILYQHWEFLKDA